MERKLENYLLQKVNILSIYGQVHQTNKQQESNNGLKSRLTDDDFNPSAAICLIYDGWLIKVLAAIFRNSVDLQDCIAVNIFEAVL